MKHKIYTLKNDVLGFYLVPIHVTNEAQMFEALSAFKNEMRDVEIHSIWYLGEFEDTTAVYELEPPLYICKLADVNAKASDDFELCEK